MVSADDRDPVSAGCSHRSGAELGHCTFHLYAVLAVHGFNGLRVILLEIKQGVAYERAINYGSIIAMIVLVAYGSRTILMAGMGLS